MPTHWSQATPLTTWLARNAYGAYIVHPPIVVGASLVAATWMLNPLAKFVAVGTVWDDENLNFQNFDLYD